jgi:insertion element IS1 protein InsB
MGVGLNSDFTSLKKLRPQSVTSYSRAVMSLSALKWTNSGATSVLNHSALAVLRVFLYTLDGCAHVFASHLATRAIFRGVCMPFDGVVWMTDGGPLYGYRLKAKPARYRKRYTQRIERHNLNLRRHLAMLGRKSTVVLKIGGNA